MNRFSMRVSLLVAILAMGALAMLLAAGAARIYRDLAYEQQREALTEQLRFLVHDQRRAFEAKARELAAPLAHDPSFLAAVRAHRVGAVARALERHARHPAVTPSETRLEKIYVYDAAQQPVVAFSDPVRSNAPPPCRSLQALFGRRKPADADKPLSGICVADRKPYYAVVLPLGPKAEAGSLHLVMDLATNLTAAESALGMPLALTFGDGARVYRSSKWPADPADENVLVTSYSLFAHADNKAYMNLSVAKDVRAFNARLADTRRVILLAAVVIALAVLQKTAIEPLRLLTAQLRRLRHDERQLGQQVQVFGNAEVVELGEGFNDMTTRLQSLYRNLESLAFSDPLTKLPNRAQFQQRLQQALTDARRDRKPFAPFLMDLDRFKEINDTLGHHVGDLLLTQVATRLREQLRPADLVARLGGDEFAVLLPGLDTQHAAMAARLLLQALNDPFTVDDSRDDARDGGGRATPGAVAGGGGRAASGDGMDAGGTTPGREEVGRRREQRPRATAASDVPVSRGTCASCTSPGAVAGTAAGEQRLSIGASVGIALYPEHGVDLHTLMQRADVAMYAAKRVNNGYAFYDARHDTGNPTRFTLLGELRLALERREFTLFYQPKVSLASGEVTGVEALVRWRHPRDGLVLPEEFIPLMEQTGMLRALTPWMLGEALSQCRTLAQPGAP